MMDAIDRLGLESGDLRGTSAAQIALIPCRGLSGRLAATPLACGAEGLSLLAMQALGSRLIRTCFRDRLFVRVAGGFRDRTRLRGDGLRGGRWLRNSAARADQDNECGHHQRP